MREAIVLAVERRVTEDGNDLAEGEWKRQSTTLQAVTGKAENKSRAVNELVEERVIERQGTGKPGDPYLLRPKSLSPFPSIGSEKGIELPQDRKEFTFDDVEVT